MLDGEGPRRAFSQLSPYLTTNLAKETGPQRAKSSVANDKAGPQDKMQ